MSDLQTYTGGCHCGAIRYKVATSLEKVISCNCSFCRKAGAILTFVPAEQFTLLTGEETLSDYQFNKKIIHHLFCTVCGVRSFSRADLPDGRHMVAINVRCLDNVDPATLTPTFFDGKNK